MTGECTASARYSRQQCVCFVVPLELCPVANQAARQGVRRLSGE